jgi:large subunit ribosomal protein L25
MKKVSLSGSHRENVGKKDAKAIRNQGHVPCVLYGGKDQVHFSMEVRGFKDLVFTPEVCFIDFDINGKKYTAVLKDVQYHPISDKIIHADFLELTGKPIKMEVPLKVEGVSPGVLIGGRLGVNYRKIAIKALPENMPEFVTINISKLEIGDRIKVAEIKSDKYEILLKDNTVLVLILKSRSAEIAQEEAAKQTTADTTEEKATEK